MKASVGETVCNVSIIKSQVAFNGGLAFLFKEYKRILKD